MKSLVSLFYFSLSSEEVDELLYSQTTEEYVIVCHMDHGLVTTHAVCLERN